MHVRFTVGKGLMAQTGEHGSSVLTSENQAADNTPVPLMNFTCQDTSGSGRHGNDDTREALWRAVACPVGRLEHLGTSYIAARV
ncbi:hypothetical protein Deide_20411 [Deinococcus deserti VCD115]|uniref:Uncharacterized protein n=1 Tax=Deinococcus deserti (strain DSM 17065 / CIP 109153 / LMG 22923 / VCD115) TaxID=546414 RepID=C1CYM8_DEIDV|nr:hypothetical protein Deide_20411 [Deinococcus deserti VCD115]